MMNDSKPTFSSDRPMYDTPHQPEHLYAKEPCPECKAKQAQIDKLRTALVGVLGGGDDDWLDSIACQVKNGKTLYIRELVALAAIEALRETMP
jgi:hypothetical protein